MITLFPQNEPSDGCDNSDLDLFYRDKQSGFDRLHMKLYPSVFERASRMLKGRPESKEIANDVFMKLWRSPKQFENIVHLRNFLLITTRNACIDWLREAKRAGIVDLESIPDDIYQILEVQDEEMLHSVLEALQKLKGQKKHVMKEIFLNGKSHKQVAQETGRSQKNITNIKAKGIKAIRNFLGLDN